MKEEKKLECERVLTRILEQGDLHKVPLMIAFNKKSEHFHYNDERIFRFMIQQLVNQGALFGSNSKRGYFLIKSEDDLEDAMDDLRTRAKSAHKRATQLYRYFYNDKDHDPQIEILFKEN